MKHKRVSFLSLLFVMLAFSTIVLSGQVFAKNKKAKTSMTVSTQKELIKALKNKKLKKLTIKTNKIESFEIPAGYYGGISLKVKAPNSRFKCVGKLFKSLDIEAASWIQALEVKKIKLHNSTNFTLYENVSVDELTVVGSSDNTVYAIKGKVKYFKINGFCKDAIIEGSVRVLEETENTKTTDSSSVTNVFKLDVKGGGNFKIKEAGIENFNLNSSCNLAVSDTSRIGQTNVNSGGKDSFIDTECPINAVVYSPCSIKLERTAVNSIIRILELTAITEVTNLTGRELKVFTPSGAVQVDDYKTVNPLTS